VLKINTSAMALEQLLVRAREGASPDEPLTVVTEPTGLAIAVMAMLMGVTHTLRRRAGFATGPRPPGPDTGKPFISSGTDWPCSTRVADYIVARSHCPESNEFIVQGPVVENGVAETGRRDGVGNLSLSFSDGNQQMAGLSIASSPLSPRTGAANRW
jgi:hypothetical protein